MQVKIKYAKVKHGRVRLSSEGDLRITIPLFKKNDIKFQQELISKGKQLLAKSQNRNQIQFVGEDFLIIFGEKKRIIVKNDLDKYLTDIYLEALIPIIEHYKQEMGINFNKINVKSLKSKWGSCSSNGNISINLKLVHLALDFTEYVVVHELAHLKHPNHSKMFRSFVGKYVPEYKKYRKELRKIVLY